MYDEKLCRKFGDCLKTDGSSLKSDINGIKIDRLSLIHPEKFKGICASRALTVSGEELDVSGILIETEKDKPFYIQSGGGVTLSGGEPLAQGPEIELLVAKLKDLNIDLAVETSLHVPWKMIRRCLGFSITFLADLKHTNKKKLKEFTGGDAALVMTNIKKLTDYNEDVIIRVPVIQGFNHTMKEMRNIIDFVRSLKVVTQLHLLPFHNLGAEKYKMLGLEYSFSGFRKVDDAEMAEYVNYANSLGLTVKIGG
jgi:pyruvate formate lyase activating enzyme